LLTGDVEPRPVAVAAGGGVMERPAGTCTLGRWTVTACCPSAARATPRGRTKPPPLTAAERATVAENTGLVWLMAARFREAQGADHDVIISEGYLGLMRAVQRFDPARGVKLSTYACQ